MFVDADIYVSADPGLTVPETIVRRAWPHHRARYQPPEGIAADLEVAARVNHGRWIVDCGFCSGAQLASPSDRRFYCVDCLHAGTIVEGRWVRVVWPRAREAIEHALERRPETARNWSPDQTVADLEAENDAAADVALVLEAEPTISRALVEGRPANAALTTEVRRQLRAGEA